MTATTTAEETAGQTAEAAEDNEHQDVKPEGVTVDLEAPYGRTAAGRPKAKPGRPRGSTGGRSRRGSGAPAAPPKKRPTTARTAAKGPDYHTGLRRALGIPVGILTAVGGRRPVFRADAVAVMMHGPAITDAVADLAEQDPRIAGVIDRFLAATPAADFVTKLSPLVVQLAANHRKIPPEVAEQMGAEKPETLINVYARRMAEAATEAA